MIYICTFSVIHISVLWFTTLCPWLLIAYLLIFGNIILLQRSFFGFNGSTFWAAPNLVGTFCWYLFSSVYDNLLMLYEIPLKLFVILTFCAILLVCPYSHWRYSICHFAWHLDATDINWLPPTYPRPRMGRWWRYSHIQSSTQYLAYRTGGGSGRKVADKPYPYLHPARKGQRVIKLHLIIVFYNLKEDFSY